MCSQLLPNWAWITLGLTLLATAIVAVLGIMLVLQPDDDKHEDALIVDSADLPVRVEVARLPTLTPTATQIPSPVPSTLTPTDLPSATPSPTLTTVASVQGTAVAGSQPVDNADAECLPPPGWTTYTVMEGDTLFAFQLGAKRAGSPATVDEIMAANCLGTTLLQIGQVLWLPAGAAENAPASELPAPAVPPGVPQTGNCPCIITIHAGWRIEQIAEQINRTSVAFAGADFLAVAGRGASLPSRDFLASVSPGAGLEGFMLPGSYILQNETTAEQFLDMVLDAFAANAAGLIGNAGVQGITPYQAVILASIIQKEAGDANEQPLVASVLYNRMRSGRALGVTVTLVYALGHPGNWWPRLQAGQTELDSPYNLNIYRGFPPTAISNPSLSALQAAISPAQTNYLYFTGNCQGTGNLYAETYDQHLANVQSCQ